MMIYPICEKYIDDRFNSGDCYYLDIEIGLKKDGFNRNVFIISYVPNTGNAVSNFELTSKIIEKNYSIDKVLEKYGFEKDEKIKKAIQNVLDFRKGKIKYL